jgi:photosystem II stability/assembly factor-like uncharacterized protein
MSARAIAALLLLGVAACGAKKAPARDGSAAAGDAVGDATTSPSDGASAAALPDAAVAATPDAAPAPAPTGAPAWRWENPRIPVADLNGVWGSSLTDVYAVGERGTILHTRDGGRTWSVEGSGTTNDLYAVWGSGADDVFVVGYLGTILHSTDGGSTWTPQQSGKWKNLNGVWGSGKGDVYITDHTGGVLHSTDSGATWKGRKSGADELHGIWGRGKDDIYLVGNDHTNDGCGKGDDHCMGYTPRGAVLHSTDGGKTWSHETTKTVPHAIWGTGPHRFIAGSAELELHDTLHHVDDDDETTDSAPIDKYMFALWGTGPGDVFAVGTEGTILHTTDARTWTPKASGVRHNLRAIWGTKGAIFVVGDYGTILRSADAGETWTALGSASAKDLHAVWGIAGGDVLAVGEDGLILRRTRGAWTSEVSGTTEPLVAVWGSAAADVYVVGKNGTILHGGAGSWKAQKSGATRLTGVWGSGKDDVYVVGGRGAILHSTDRGATWTAQTSGVKEDLTGVWGNGKEHVFVIGDSGALLHSADSGATWSKAPQLVKRALGGHDTFGSITGNGDVDVYIVGAGRILRSTDSGKTWKVDETDDRDGIPTTAWAYGADVYVVSNRIGAASWWSLNASILHSADGGVHWMHVPRPDTGDDRWGTGLYGIAGVGDDLYVVGWAGAILRYGR